MSQEILDSQTQRTKGQDAILSNILAIKALSDIVKTTLGPYGMDKMLIDGVGNSIITNDGVQILKSMDIAHPAAELVVEIAKNQDKNVGDGTTSTVILIASMLDKAQELYQQNIHPNIIVKEFIDNCNFILSNLNSYSIDISNDLKKFCKDIIMTAMRGKSSENNSEYLSKLIVNSILNSKTTFNRKKFKTIKVIGPSVEESRIINGVVFDKKKILQNMPNSMTSAKVLVSSVPIEVQEIENSHQIQLQSYQQYEEFVIQEKKYLKDIANQIIELGINVVICQKGVDDSIVSYLAKHNILVLRRCRKSDIELFSTETQCSIVSNLDELSKNNVVEIQKCEVLEIGDDEVISFSIKESSCYSMIVCGSTMHVLDEIDRAIEDSIGNISNVLKHKKIVAGGGAIETQLHINLIEYSKSKTGKSQLITEYFAQSFLSIPQILAKNCGLDEIEIISNLKHSHQKNKIYSGIDSSNGVCEDVVLRGIIEPLGVVEQIILNSKEAISMILRIDDIIAAKKIDLDNQKFEDF